MNKLLAYRRYCWARGFVFLSASAQKQAFSEGQGTFLLLEVGALPARKGIALRKKICFLPQSEKIACARREISMRTKINFRAHENIFLCARNFERFTQALLSPCPLPSFSLVNRPPIPRGLPWSACPPAESPSVHRGILPYKPYLCIPQGLGGSHPTLKGRAFQRINDNDAEIRYP